MKAFKKHFRHCCFSHCNNEEIAKYFWKEALEWVLKQRIAILNNEGNYCGYDIIAEHIIKEELEED